MTRITLLFMTAAMLTGGVVAAIEGCSSSNTATPGGSSTSSSSSSGDDGTSGTSGTSSSSSSSSSGTVLTDAAVPTGLPPSNPDQYTCGSVTCDAGGPNDNPNNPPVCCLRPSAQTGTACVQSSDCNNEGALDASLQVICDESADCPQANNGQQEACCYLKDVEGRNGDQTTFQTVCGRPGHNGCINFDTNDNQFDTPVLCHTSSDCSDAGVDSGTAGTAAVCNLKTCDGFQLYVCGTPTGCQ